MKNLLKHNKINNHLNRLSLFGVLVAISIGSLLFYTGMRFNPNINTTIELLSEKTITAALNQQTYEQKIKSLGFMIFATDPNQIDEQLVTIYFDALQSLANQGKNMKPAEQDLFEALLTLTKEKIVGLPNKANFTTIVDSFQNSLRKEN